MIEESKAMKELHKIREKMHEDTKHMSSLEKVQFIKEKADKAKQNLKLKNKITIGWVGFNTYCRRGLFLVNLVCYRGCFM